jgi:predicted MarR family transcription regulator
MTEEATNLRLERLLADALQPIEPPEDLATRVETTLSGIAEQAAAELASWAEELSEGELQALRDPRNWVRPVAAVAVGGAAAAGALLLVEMRRRRRPDGIRDTAERLLRDLRP